MCSIKNFHYILAPKFSIIIPVYNRASFIKATLESIYNQKSHSFEVIVVDDGSTDELFLILSDYIETKGLIYIYQSNRGVSSARNRGVSSASGDYILFLDSDDRVSPSWLTDYESQIKINNPDIVYCGINRIKDNIVIEYSDPQDPFKNGIDFGNVIPGSFCLKKSFFEVIGGYDEQLAYGENTELGFRIKYALPKMAFINAPNLLYFIHQNSHGKNARNKMNGLIYTINKHPQIFNLNSDLASTFFSIVGVAASNCGKFDLAKKYFIKSFAKNPFKIKSLLRLILVSIPIMRNLFWPRL